MTENIGRTILFLFMAFFTSMILFVKYIGKSYLYQDLGRTRNQLACANKINLFFFLFCLPLFFFIFKIKNNINYVKESVKACKIYDVETKLL